MGNPTGSDLYVSYPLSSISVNYFQSDVEFIADKVFPIVPVQFQGGLYWEFDRGSWMKARAMPRSPGSETTGAGWTQTQHPYYAVDYGFHKDNADQDYANVGAPLNLDESATLFVSRAVNLTREEQFVSTYMKTGVWTGGSNAGDITGVASSPSAGQVLQWDVANSTILEDIAAQKEAVLRKTGFMPNKLILGPDVWQQGVLNNPELVARISVNQTRIVTPQLFAALIGVQDVLIPHVLVDSANDGATDSFGFAYGKSALLCYAPPAAALNVPSAGYIFAWTGYLGDQAFGCRIKRFRIEERASWRIEGECAFDMHVVGTDLGVFFNTVVS